MLAALAGLAIAAGARAQYMGVPRPREEVLARRDARWSVAVTGQFLKDDIVERTTGLGLEIRGPDPDRDLGRVVPKLVGGWRVGINRFDFTYTDPRLSRTSTSEVLMLNLGAGYDYDFRREARTPFLGMFVHGLMPYRQTKLPGIRDEPDWGLDLSLGYRFSRGFIRLDQTLLLTKTNAQQVALGWSF